MKSRYSLPRSRSPPHLILRPKKGRVPLGFLQPGNFSLPGFKLLLFPVSLPAEPLGGGAAPSPRANKAGQPGGHLPGLAGRGRTSALTWEGEKRERGVSRGGRGRGAGGLGLPVLTRS